MPSIWSIRPLRVTWVYLYTEMEGMGPRQRLKHQMRWWENHCMSRKMALIVFQDSGKVEGHLQRMQRDSGKEGTKEDCKAKQNEGAYALEMCYVKEYYTESQNYWSWIRVISELLALLIRQIKMAIVNICMCVCLYIHILIYAKSMNTTGTGTWC